MKLSLHGLFRKVLRAPGLIIRQCLRLMTFQRPVFSNTGHCDTCNRDVRFTATHTWFRDHYLCQHCRSKPRERALMRVLEMYFPDWRVRVIHESSPINRGASLRLAKECSSYIPSQLFAGVARGELNGGIRCEDLGALTFDDTSIDLHITQDVMEHVLDPAAVFREIARTLKPGGAHVFTVPIVNKHKPSAVRARLAQDGQVKYLVQPAIMAIRSARMGPW